MRYQPMFDIWEVPHDLLRKVQPGQMVYAGDRSNTGRFLGVKPSGTVVVAWSGNMRNHKDQLGYVRSLLQYAKGK